MTDTRSELRREIAETIIDAMDDEGRVCARSLANTITEIEQIEEGAQSRQLVMEIYDVMATSDTSSGAHSAIVDILNRFANDVMFKAFCADKQRIS
jgi:hypothetical protein